MKRWYIVLSCGHRIELGGKLAKESTRIGRVLYCGECRSNQTLDEYGVEVST